jgi:hypothetical protein
MKSAHVDPNRAELLSLIQELNGHLLLVRDFAVTPGNIWLAKDSLSKVTALLTDVETTLEAIKQADDLA